MCEEKKEGCVYPTADEAAIEQEIQDKGLTAPRLTPDAIDGKIKRITFTTLPSGKAVVCEITLQNGFTVRGESACVSVANFDEEIGNKIALKNARDKIWQLEGYLLQEKYPVIEPEGPASYQDRVRAEKKELDEKIVKLSAFLDGDNDVASDVFTLMNGQRVAMQTYSDILAGRIRIFDTF